jgi:pyruvate dehydrogenase E2 component (dihydrolipoamide acetyltransferase)
MATEFTLPELGENITAGDVVRVLVSPGDTVAKDQPILELETDKATIEVPSSVAGTVRDIRVKQGEKVKVGQVVLTVEDGAEEDKKAAPAEGAKKTEAKEPKADKGEAPKAKGQSVDAAASGGQAQRVSGESAEEGEGAAAPAAGDGAERGAAERGTGEAEQPEAQQAENETAARRKRGEVVDITTRQAAPTAAPQEPEPGAMAAPASPSVRRLARELGVDIQRVTGSGPGGRISAEDLQNYVKSVMSGSTQLAEAVGSAAGAIAPAALPDLSKWGEVERKPMSNIRRKTAEHLSNAWNQIPHVTQHDKADITAIEALRKQYSAQAEQAGGKLTVTAIALKIVAGGMKKFPQFNAAVDMARQEIVYRKSIHIGVAVDTERGLLVPVIRDVDRKGIIELSGELAKLSEKARAGKLALDEMQGGGLSITNLGGIGGTSFTPIVNWPEAAILGMSRGAYEPFWDGAQFVPKLMLPLSLSYDHRVIDGADAARFLRWVCEAFEQPFVLVL